MKKYFPLLFLGLTLLAKAFAHGYILSHPVVWPQAPVEHLPQSLEAFTFLSSPVCILMFFWIMEADSARMDNGKSPATCRNGTTCGNRHSVAFFHISMASGCVGR